MERTKPDTEDYAVLIGIDWATQKHDLWYYDCSNGHQSHQVIQHKPEALATWISELQTRYNNRLVAICLEQSRGALIHALMGYDFIHLYPVNPTSLSRYRQAFCPSRAKDDPSDAQLLMELLLKHRDKFKVWKPDDEITRSLALLCEHRRKAVNWRTRLVLRLRATLMNYFPQAPALLANNLTSELACALIQKWPTLSDIQRAQTKTIRSFYYAHNYRRGDLIEKNIEIIREAKPLTKDPAIITSLVITAQTLAKQIRDINMAVEQYDQAIKQLFKQHPDAYIYQSLPGAGDALAPRLLAALGTDRNRFSHAAEIQTFSGIAPVTERSGKKTWVHWRWACSKFIRQSFHEFANCSRKYSTWADAFYELQRQRGKSHHAAIRALAYKWQRIIFRCWKDRKPYDEQQYLSALKARGSVICPMLSTS